MSKKKKPGAGKASAPPQRMLVPAELRYQFLRAGPGRAPVEIWGVAQGIGLVVGVVASIASERAVGLIAGVLAALLVGVALRRLVRLLPRSKGYRAAPVGIVPWGLVIDPDGDPTPVPWSRLRNVDCTLTQSDRNRWNQAGGYFFGTRWLAKYLDPNREVAPAHATILFETDVGVVQAVGEDGEWLTELRSVRARVASAAQCWPAGDLYGTAALEVDGIPISLALIRHAEAILSSVDGRASLDVQESGDYRTTLSRVAGPATLDILRRALWKGDNGLDPGPLAAVLAAELGIAQLLPDLLRLILSPSPLVAAVAKAGAMRLGASLIVTGSFDEVERFLPAEVIAELRIWAAKATP